MNTTVDVETRLVTENKTAIEMDFSKADIGLIGLAVMGQNLALNMVDNGFKVCVYNRTTSKVDEFLSNEAKGIENITGAHSLATLADQLKKPKCILLMVRAGEAVDTFIGQLTPLLEKGDIIIDGGNSDHTDTTRRCRFLSPLGILYMGIGISGGETGARHGPSIMPGGHFPAWAYTKPILQAIAAKANGKPCCEWIGQDGAGHFVKTIHNGIGYADMQLLAEAYHIMKGILKMNPEEISKAFDDWNEGKLDWFLLRNTADILRFKDEKGDYLVEKILDSAGQKGTGKWAVIASLDCGIPITVISESVFARYLSSLKSERLQASRTLSGPEPNDYQGDRSKLIEDIKNAVYASKIVLYAQGFMLLKEAEKNFGDHCNYVDIAHMWRGGCVIRSVLLDSIKTAFEKDPNIRNLLLDEYFVAKLREYQSSWRRVITTSINFGIPVPGFSAALAYYDGYRCERLPANLLQAQRDYVGAHCYELLDQPGVFHHTNWTGHGGRTSATNYQA